jgi:hypothetical protein
MKEHTANPQIRLLLSWCCRCARCCSSAGVERAGWCAPSTLSAQTTLTSTLHTSRNTATSIPWSLALLAGALHAACSAPGTETSHTRLATCKATDVSQAEHAPNKPRCKHVHLRPHAHKRVFICRPAGRAQHWIEAPHAAACCSPCQEAVEICLATA